MKNEPRVASEYHFVLDIVISTLTEHQLIIAIGE
jgi:hypothetical protein